MRSFFVFLTLALLGTNAQADMLRIGTESGFAPYISRNSENELIGFDKDLMDAICQEIDAECLWSDVAFTSLIPALLENDIDAIIGGLSITQERRALIDFSKPYLSANGALIFVGLRYAIDPRSARIAVQTGTVFENYLSDNDYDFVSFPTGAAALESTESGATDLVFGTEGNLEPQIFSSGNRLKIVQRIIPEIGGVAIGLQPDDQALKLRIESALTKFLSDGTIEALTQRWFPAGERV